MIIVSDEPIDVVVSRKELSSDDHYTSILLHLDGYECESIEVSVHDQPSSTGFRLYLAATSGEISGDDLRALRSFFNDPRIVALCEDTTL